MLTDTKIKALAVEYKLNGGNRTEALIAIGYSKTYAQAYGKKLFDNVKLKEHISQLEAKSSVITGITIETLQSEINELQATASIKGDLTTVARCLELKGKTIGAFTENLNTNDLAKQVELQSISDKEKVELKRIANIRLSEMMTRPIAVPGAVVDDDNALKECAG